MHPLYFDIVFLSIIGLLEFILAIFIFIKYQKNAAITAFGFFTLGVSGWVLANGPTLLLPNSNILYDPIIRLAFIFPLFFLNFFYLFVTNYPYPDPQQGRKSLLFIFLPTIVFSLLIFFSRSLVIGFNNTPKGESNYGPDYWIYSFYLFFIFTFSVFEVILKINKVDGVHKKNLRIFSVAVFVSGLIGFLSHIILPYFLHVSTPVWVGPGSSLIWLVSIGYVLFKKA